MDAQMKKGVLELCLLYLISTKESYGYELLSDMKSAFPDVNESTIYAVLRRIQADGLAESYRGEESGGPVRKYLRITQNGRTVLKENIESWHSLINAVQKIGID